MVRWFHWWISPVEVQVLSPGPTSLSEPPTWRSSRPEPPPPPCHRSCPSPRNRWHLQWPLAAGFAQRVGVVALHQAVGEKNGGKHTQKPIGLEEFFSWTSCSRPFPDIWLPGVIYTTFRDNPIELLRSQPSEKRPGCSKHQRTAPRSP